MRRHALDTSTNTNIDHARFHGIGNIHDRLKTARALTVQTLDGSRLGEARHQGGSTEFRRTTTRGKDGADSNVVDLAGVDSAAVDDSLEDTSQQVSGSGVLETTFSTLCKSRTQSAGHDDIIGVLLRDGGDSLLATRAEVGSHLRQTLLG